MRIVLLLNAAALETDSLFQLNVLIWASIEQPPGSPINAALLEGGYGLWAIEQPLASSPIERAKINASGWAIGQNPVADGILMNESLGRFAIIECKAASFGVDSSNSEQARGLIVAGGNVSERLGGGTPSEAEVCYVVPSSQYTAMDQTLVSLCDDLTNSGFPPCSTGTIGIAVLSDGIYLLSVGTRVGSALVPDILTPQQLIMTVESDQDPRPLYIIPWIPNSNDESASTAFREKLRSQVLSCLGTTQTLGSHTYRYEQILDNATGGVFSKWEDSNSLHNQVFPTVQSIIRSLVKNDARVTVSRSSFDVRIQAASDREELLETVRTSEIPERLPEGIQGQLFDPTK